jgi:HEAT repeat protein
MNCKSVFLSSLLLFLPPVSFLATVARADDDVVQTVINLVSDKDKDVRAIGLEQVRDEAKGAEATRRFAAKPAVLEMLKASQGEVRTAAIRALGPLGDKSDVPQLVALLDDAKSQKDAVAALTLLHGEGVNAALCGQLKTGPSPARGAVVKLLVARHSTDSLPDLLTASKDKDATVRAAALEALGQLGGPELIAKLAREILDAKDKASREEAEMSLALIARRDPKNPDPVAPLLKVMDGMGESEKSSLLPTLGRIGGPSARKVVDANLADGDSGRRLVAILALRNWPDGSVAQKLAELVQTGDNLYSGSEPGLRQLLVDALIRVAPLPDGRPDAERLAMLKKAMELASNDAQRNAVIKRARAIRTLDTLHFVAPYMDEPLFAEIACESVVELAHHKELRQPNKADFNKALDKVILLSKDPEVIRRAKHYLKDET